ncbi:MAG: IPT/TIG domain-containing protein [Aliidongia sp.]
MTAPTGTAGTMAVRVTTAGGTSTAVPADQYTYETVPTVTGLTPSAGPLAGGNTVTVSGTGFVSGATAVSFGGTPGTAVAVASATSLTVTAPIGSAGTVDVRVMTAGGTSTTVPADLYTYEVVPAVTTLSPTAGPLGGGNTVTVTGSGFVIGATSVSFGSMPGTGVVVSGPTSLTVTARSARPGR